MLALMTIDVIESSPLYQLMRLLESLALAGSGSNHRLVAAALYDGSRCNHPLRAFRVSLRAPVEERRKPRGLLTRPRLPSSGTLPYY